MRIIWLFILSFFLTPLSAQDSLLQNLDTLSIQMDSLQTELDSTRSKSNSSNKNRSLLLSGLEWTRPSKAALYSLILPGAGQFYNKQFIKTPIYPGAIALFGSSAIASRTRYKNFKESLLFKVGSSDITSDPFPELSKMEVRTKMDRNRRLSNWSVAGAGFSYASGIIDAYVTGHIIKREAETEGLHLPIKAGYYSAILPGCGQIYNKKWWKVPIIYAGFTGIGVYSIYSYSNMKSFRDAYLARNRYGLEDEYSDGEGRDYSDGDLLVLKDFHKRNFERSILFGTAWYALNVIDAVVDAHLYNFEISDDLSFQPFPYSERMYNNELVAGLGIRFSLN